MSLYLLSLSNEGKIAPKTQRHKYIMELEIIFDKRSKSRRERHR